MAQIGTADELTSWLEEIHLLRQEVRDLRQTMLLLLLLLGHKPANVARSELAKNQPQSFADLLANL